MSWSRKSSRRLVTAIRALACGMAIGCGLLAKITVADDTVAIVDTREVFGPAAPSWLRAIGRLQVPGGIYRNGVLLHLLEDCSATLITHSGETRADTIITAWHCLENYRDLSRPIVFTLAPGSAPREAYLLADGGGMHADWALLRLRLPVATLEATAIGVHPGRADPDRTISMAGYSRDAGKGNGGRQLTFDPACHITAEGPDNTNSDCLAYKGASGGAVVQLSASGAAQFSGVVSVGDGAGISSFVPVAVFRSALRQHLGRP